MRNLKSNKQKLSEKKFKIYFKHIFFLNINNKSISFQETYILSIWEIEAQLE